MPIKYQVEVTITKVVDVWLEDETATQAFQDSWRRGLWDIEGIDDIAKYAAETAACYGKGNHDGLGYLNGKDMTWPKKGDTEYNVVSEEVESEILERP